RYRWPLQKDGMRLLAALSLRGNDARFPHALIFNMTVQEQIQKYITSQPEPKRSDMHALHVLTLQVLPGCKLWFLDGKDSENKTVSNPNIGYGSHTIKYADGTNR